MQTIYKLLSIFITIFFISTAYAGKIVNISAFDKAGKTTAIGTIEFEDTPYGMLITPNLTSLPPGLHGFHVHEHADCQHEGMDAGAHLDPAKTGKHLGPYSNKGHLGDLPALYVDGKGNATLPTVAPRIKITDLNDHAIMVHEGGDNYSDNPKLGGGGARIACGF